MAKPRTKYVCQECGYETPRWLGKCPGCGAWGSLAEEVVTKPVFASPAGGLAASSPLPITEIESASEYRFSSGSSELDRVLGGGIVPGSVVLLGGDPGIGKSTLLLQVSNAVSAGFPVLYVSGEESARQIKLRAERLRVCSPGLLVVAEVDMDRIERHIDDVRPGLVVVDSIQTVYSSELESAPGSVSQVRECAARLLRKAKEAQVPVFLVGHVTKSGMLAGPRVLEHVVDTVLYFEGERHHSFRILRAVKNRFGSTNEIGVFEMGDLGLAEVENPSELFLSGRVREVSGLCVTASMEGSRPILVEIEALVCSAPFGTPRRTTTGVDASRVAIILAVLEKRAGLLLSSHDVYVSVAGGARLDERASDLAIACAIASSFRNAVCDPKTVIIGEVGLSGEVRAASRVDARLAESAKLGFERCIVPLANARSVRSRDGLRVEGVATIGEALEIALGG
ncbi:MAG: DNA repair protein RadA [Firmicutes bacterium]|nr:DNA repair protein RadA [Bacillota bacterium]MDH7495998.1 DNA repair protein RadA [Bacillota bacterium]